MTAITRLTPDGYGGRRLGSFSGKTGTEEPAGAHPVTRITRLGYGGYGVRRNGSFAGRLPTGGGVHPVSLITRMGIDGYGYHRAGSYAGKTPEPVAPASPHPVGRITRLALDAYGAKRPSSFSGKSGTVYFINAQAATFVLSEAPSLSDMVIDAPVTEFGETANNAQINTTGLSFDESNELVLTTKGAVGKGRGRKREKILVKIDNQLIEVSSVQALFQLLKDSRPAIVESAEQKAAELIASGKRISDIKRVPPEVIQAPAKAKDAIAERLDEVDALYWGRVQKAIQKVNDDEDAMALVMDNETRMREYAAALTTLLGGI